MSLLHLLQTNQHVRMNSDKDHVTLKTGVMAAEKNQLFQNRIKLHFKIYSNTKQLF